MLKRSPSIFWGGLLVIVGVLFLLANFGVFDNLDWGVVWPFLVIALGVWLLAARIGPGGASTIANLAAPREGLEKATLDVAIGTGRVNVRAMGLEDQLYRLHIENSGQTPEVTLNRSTGTVRIAQKADLFVGARRLHMDARLSDAIPWQVTCATGAVHADFDMTTAKLGAFDCRTGASTIELSLGPPQGVIPIHVEGGALTVRIMRPAGAAIQVQASGAGLQLRTDGTRQDGMGTRTWASDGFAAAGDRYEVMISGGALNVEISGR